MKNKIILTLSMIFLSTLAYADLPYKKINWPGDDKPHLSNPQVVTELWTYTGKVTAKNGEDKARQFFYYVTLRYTRDATGDVPTLNLIVTDINNEKVYGNSIELKDVHSSSDSLDITSRNFSLQSNKDKYDLHLTMPVHKTTIILDLQFTALKKPILMGSDDKKRGLSNMGDNTNGFDYSISNLLTTGYIQIGDEKFTIDSDQRLSSSWMDHQWGDFSLAKAVETHAWIWVAARLRHGIDVSVKEFIKPTTDKRAESKTSASISLQSSKTEYKKASIQAGPVTEGGYPAYYRLKVGDKTYHLEPIVKELNRNNTWVGILKIDGQNISGADAPFAIVESMVPQL